MQTIDRQQHGSDGGRQRDDSGYGGVRADLCTRPCEHHVGWGLESVWYHGARRQRVGVGRDGVWSEQRLGFVGSRDPRRELVRPFQRLVVVVPGQQQPRGRAHQRWFPCRKCHPRDIVRGGSAGAGQHGVPACWSVGVWLTPAAEITLCPFALLPFHGAAAGGAVSWCEIHLTETEHQPGRSRHCRFFLGVLWSCLLRLREHIPLLIRRTAEGWLSTTCTAHHPRSDGRTVRQV